MLTDLLRRAETEAFNAGHWTRWGEAYQRLRATHQVRQAALLALREVGLVDVADDLEAADAHGTQAG
jgi:hypothetical protein